MTDTFTYPGNELTLFQHAKNWKQYYASELHPYISGDVLEAGAGLGANTSILRNNKVKTWTLLEPDYSMFSLLAEKYSDKKTAADFIVVNGTLEHVSGLFDTIVYIDVLEHIEKDKPELKKAASLLQKGGHLIVLSPAYNFLFSDFDKAIGHFRRYTKKSLLSAAPPSLKVRKVRYLDTMGFFGYFANKVFIKQKFPEKKHIKLWDHFFVPVSKITDKIFLHRFGKSIIAVWKKEV